MARSRRGGGNSGGGGLFGSRKKEAPKTTPAPRRAPPPPAPMQSQPAQSGGMLSGIGSTIAQGMAFGTGSAIAHRAVGAVAGSFSGSGGDSAPVEQTQQAAPITDSQSYNQQLQGPCATDKVMFFDCLKVNRGDQESCSFLYEQLQTCQRNESQMSFN